MSFLSGLCLGISATLMLINNIFSKRIRAAREEKEDVRWGKVTLITISLVGYIFSMKNLGFIISTMLFVGILLKSIEKKGWGLTTLVSIAIALGSYIVFKIGLKADLPIGIFGF